MIQSKNFFGLLLLLFVTGCSTAPREFRENVDAKIREREPLFRLCFKDVNYINQTIRVDTAFKILATGTVTDVRVVKSQTLPRVDRCLEETLSRITYQPTPLSIPHDYTYNFYFSFSDH